MEITKTENNTVEVQYTVTEGDLIYMDTVTFTPEHYSSLSNEDIDTMIANKFIEWKVYIETPAKEPTIAEKEEKLAILEKQKLELNNEIANLTQEISTYSIPVGETI